MFDTKAKAMAWGYAREAELRDQRKGIVKATLQDAIDKFIVDVCPNLKSGENYAKRLRALSRQPGLLPVLRQVNAVTAADLTQFRDTRLVKVSVATVRKELTIIRSVLESARRDWGMLAVNPISDVKKPPAPPDRNRLFVGDETDRIIAALGFEGKVTNTRHQTAVCLLLALETAMRSGELIGLTWDRVHLKAQYVSLLETKNGDQRDVALSLRAVALLKLMVGLHKERVFTIDDAVRDVLFRNARDTCGIKNLHFHDSRANAIVMLSKKLDIHDLARMIGHRNLNSLLIYYRPTAQTLAAKLG